MDDNPGRDDPDDESSPPPGEVMMSFQTPVSVGTWVGNTCMKCISVIRDALAKPTFPENIYTSL